LSKSLNPKCSLRKSGISSFTDPELNSLPLQPLAINYLPIDLAQEVNESSALLRESF